LSKPTVSQALAGLEGVRLVRGAGRSSGGKGPTALLYELNPQAGWVVGLDVGRGWVRAAIANLTGEIIARRDERAHVKSADALISQIGDVAHGLAADAGITWGRVTFATVGSPGVFDVDSGQLTLAHNLPGWGREGLVDAVREVLGTNVGFENDVNLATLGERWGGLGKDVANFVYVHVGSGVGMGIVVNGELFRGSRGLAGEIGYLPLATADPHHPENLRRGALESTLGAAAVIAVARSFGMKPPITSKKVFTAARRGDETGIRVTEIVAQRIALAVAAVVPVLDPELVILGGGIGRNGDLLLEPFDREFRALSPFRPRVEVASLGEDAELTGAVASALEAAQDQLFSRPSASRG
jgi:predicted NBD/HSP70 family sugar kinase